MSELSTLEEVYSEWQNNSQFKQEFKTNPEQALKKAGLALSTEDLNKILSMLELKTQINQNEELDKKDSK